MPVELCCWHHLSRVFLRLALNAFAAGAGKFFDSVACILEQIGAIRQGGDKQVAATWLLQPCFTQLLPVLSQLLAVLPGREPKSLPCLVQFLSPVCAVLETARWLSTEAPARLAPLLRACNEGLQAFLAGVAGLLMAQNSFQEFPLDLGHRDVRDSAAGVVLADPELSKAKDALEEAIGAFEISPQESQAPPEVILEILSGRGRGGSLVAELLTTSRFKSPTASASHLLVAAFAAALLGGGSAAIEQAAEDPSASSAATYWRQVLDPRSTVLDLGEDTHITAILTSVTVYSWPRGPNFFAISSSGFVVPWGTYPTPPKVLQDIRCIQMTGMGYAYAAIRHDGSVVCWGDPEGGGDCREVQGELKEVVAIQSSDSSEVQSQLKGVVSVQTTTGAFAAIRADGAVVTWGNPDAGGDSTDVQEQLTQVVQIQSSEMGFAALRADGQVIAWPWTLDNFDEPEVQRKLRNVTQINATALAFAAVCADGSVATWGLSDTEGDSSQVQQQLQDVQNIQENGCAFAAIRGNGTVVAWGDAQSGGDSSTVNQQLGEIQEAPDDSDRAIMQHQLPTPVQVQATNRAFAAVRLDGRVVAWGDPAYGGDTSRVQQHLFNILQVQATSGAFAAIRSDGQVFAWGDPKRGGDSSQVQDQLTQVQYMQANDSAFVAVRKNGTLAENFVQKKVRPAKQAIAAEEGDAAAFEAALADRLTWLVRHVVWSSQVAPPPTELSRASTSPIRRPKVPQETDSQLRWPLSPPGKAARQRLKELHRAGSGDHDSSEAEEGAHLLSGIQMQLLAQLSDEYSKGKGKDSQQDGACSDGTVSRVSFEASVQSQRQLAIRKQLGLRLLRHLAKTASEAQDLDLLLPSLQEALEPSLTSPLRGIAQSGIGARRAVLDELSLLLREVVAACTTEVSRPLGLSFLCLPLPKVDMEGVLGSLLSGLPALALDCQQGPAQLLTARVASLVLRVYLDGPGSGSSVEAAILNQVEALLEQISNAEGQVPVPMVSSMTEPLEVDWDMGAFGRLRSRKLDMSGVKQMAAAVAGEDAADGEVQNLSLSKLRELRASGEISDVAFCAMLLRLSQAEAGRGLNDVCVDAVEFQHAMCLARGQSSPWTSSLRAGVCAAALSFLRRGASKAGEAPATAEKLIQVASRSTSFVSTLAINLYFKLQLPDDKVAAHVPQFLALLGEADAATEGLSSARRRGCLATASCLSLELAKRATAVIPTVRRLLADAVDRSEDATVRSALRVLGGVRRCSSYHMQAVSTCSGAAIVVGADERSAVLLTLQGDVKMLTRLPWSSLEGHCGTWPTEWQDDEILALLRQSLQKSLREGAADAAEGPRLELLRATASALHGSGCWDASLLAEVVRALDRLAPNNKRSPSSCFVELAEHRCLLLRLSMAMAGTATQDIEPRRTPV
eukprot:s517_g1.t1